MRDLVVSAIVFGLLPFVLARPYVGIYLFSWISYMNPHRLSWGFAYDMPFAALAAGATLLGMLVSSKEVKRIAIKPLAAVWFAWIAWMNVTTFFAMRPEVSVVEWERSIKIQLMAVITLLLLQSRTRIIGLVAVIVVSLGFFGVKGGIFTLVTGGHNMVWGPPGSFIGGNTSLGLALLMTMPLMLFLAQQVSSLWPKLVLWGAAGLTFVAVLGTHSRGAFVGLVFLVIFVLMKTPKRLVVAPLVMAVLFAGFDFMPQEYTQRLETIETYEQDESALGRINAWWFAFNLAKDHPITGGGFDIFSRDLFIKYAPEPYNHHDAHSIYFEVMAEHGFVGLGLFLALAFLALREGGRISRLAKGRDDLVWAGQLGRMTQASLVAYATSGAFLGLAYFDLYYHLIAILILTRNEVDKALLKAETEEPQGELASSPPIQESIAGRSG
jgi:putative inorganic carbon (HCO3(-)) transporter